MSDASLAAAAVHYGVDLAEARRRFARITELTAKGEPVCVICAKHPNELREYHEPALDAGVTPVEYVRSEEGTYNAMNGHFLCNECYILAGMPSSDHGWTAP